VSRNRTSLVIAHRRSTMSALNEIIVLTRAASPSAETHSHLLAKRWDFSPVCGTGRRGLRRRARGWRGFRENEARTGSHRN